MHEVVGPGRHPKNPINQALKAISSSRFAVLEIHSGHRWGVVICRACGDEIAIWSTPRVPENNAAAIQRFAERHKH